MGVAGGGPEFDSAGNKVDDGAQFVDLYSRLGFRMSHAITSDMTALGHVEWRFTGDERNTNQGFNEVRQSYIGLSSNRFGTLLAGNFNSMYAQFVSLPFDVYQDRGLLFKSSGLQSWGDSIAYYTPELNGFTSFLQVKHYSERGLTTVEQRSEGEVVAEMVDNVQCSSPLCGLHQTITDEYEDQTDVLKHQRFTLTNNADACA